MPSSPCSPSRSLNVVPVSALDEDVALAVDKVQRADGAARPTCGSGTGAQPWWRTKGLCPVAPPVAARCTAQCSQARSAVQPGAASRAPEEGEVTSSRPEGPAPTRGVLCKEPAADILQAPAGGRETAPRWGPPWPTLRAARQRPAAPLITQAACTEKVPADRGPALARPRLLGYAWDLPFLPPALHPPILPFTRGRDRLGGTPLCGVFGANPALQHHLIASPRTPSPHAVPQPLG